MAVAVTRQAPSPDSIDIAAPDRRVSDLHRLIDSGDFDLLSLDVFDTLVWRMVPTPSDVFFLMARALMARGVMYASSSPESFVRERVDAETRARERTPSREVTLAEIYRAFPRGYLRGIDPADVAGIELETERSVVRVNPDMAALLARAKARGMRTALVSDTYFSSRDIARLTGVRVDHVVVSCERGVSKAYGLHRALIDASGVTPERILHVGDNLAADIEGPGALDLARYWFRKLPEAYDGLLDLELPTILSARAPYIAASDGGMTALRGRAMFQCATEYERWGAGVLGPVITGFADWVIERCRDLGVSTALCLMREGRVLARVLDLQTPGFAARELFVSRFVALKAAILDGTAEEIEKFVLRPSPQPVGKILRQLGLEPDAAGDATTLLTPDATRDLIARIARTDRMRRAVVASSAGVRANLLQHLGGLVTNQRPQTVAVVDLGYNGTIQGALQRVLDRERTGITTHGLYLVTGAVHAAQSSGCALEGWLAENHQPVAVAHTFMRSPEIVEQSLMADCGTTLGHDDDGTPVLDDCHVPDDQRAQIAEIQTGLLRYAGLWAELEETRGAVPSDALRALARAICIRSVARPLPIELELFADWRHDENLGSATTRTLSGVTELHEWEQAHLSAHQLASLPSRRVYWPFGFAHEMGEAMGQAVAHIHLRSAAPEAFDSGHTPQPIAFQWDMGAGFDAANATVQEYRVNSRGRAWQRFSMETRRGTHTRYAVSIGRPGDVVRLAGFRVHRLPEGGVASVTDVVPAAVEAIGYAPLGHGLLAVERDAACFVLPADGVRDFTGVIHVDVFFTLIPEA